MKIIGVDNFDRDYVSDILVCEKIHESYATAVCEALNEKFGGPYATRFFKVVNDDHELYEGKP